MWPRRTDTLTASFAIEWLAVTTLTSLYYYYSSVTVRPNGRPRLGHDPANLQPMFPPPQSLSTLSYAAWAQHSMIILPTVPIPLSMASMMPNLTRPHLHHDADATPLPL